MNPRAGQGLSVEVGVTQTVERNGFAPPIGERRVERERGHVARRMTEAEGVPVRGIDGEVDLLSHDGNRTARSQHVHDDEGPARLAPYGPEY